MTDNPFIFDSEDTPYLKHHFQEKCWYRGKESIDVNYFMIDPDTMLMGWGKYTSGEGYSYVWQKDLFTNIARPDDEYKKAFSVWVLPKFVNDKDNITHSVSLWQRHSFGEYKGFQEMGASFYAESQNKQTVDSLTEIINSNSDKIRVDALIKLSREYFYSDTVTFWIHINEAIQLSKEIDYQHHSIFRFSIFQKTYFF